MLIAYGNIYRFLAGTMQHTSTALLPNAFDCVIQMVCLSVRDSMICQGVSRRISSTLMHVEKLALCFPRGTLTMCESYFIFHTLMNLLCVCV